MSEVQKLVIHSVFLHGLISNRCAGPLNIEARLLGAHLIVCTGTTTKLKNKSVPPGFSCSCVEADTQLQVIKAGLTERSGLLVYGCPSSLFINVCELCCIVCSLY